MAVQIINASGVQYGMVVNPDGSINTNQSAIPSSGNNSSLKLIYDPVNNLGSIYKTTNGITFVKVLTYATYSGTSIGLGSNLSNVGTWVVSGT